MAKGNKIEVTLQTKVKDSPLNRLKQKMDSMFPSLKKLENKMSKLGSKINSSGIQKLSNEIFKLQSPIRTVKNVLGTLGKMAINSRGFNILTNSMERIPFFGKKIASTIDTIRDKINTGNWGKGFEKLKEKIKSVKEKAVGLIKTFSKLGAVTGLIGGLIGGLSFAGLSQASDENSLRNSRLSMVTSDVQGLKQKTFNAAQSSGADYGAQLDSIAKLKMLTNGLFNDNEAVKFTSTLDKAFKVSGTGAGEAAAAMYQLNQAMTSGKLQGDEFRSVMENAPILAQKIAESMGVSMGELKKLGSQGKITSEVIKKAVLGSAEDIESKYAQMPLTFGKVWQQAKNAGQQAMDGLLTKINELLNTPMGQKMAQNLQQGMSGLATMANGALDGFLSILSQLNLAPLLEPLKGIGQMLSQAFSGVSGGDLTGGIAGGLNLIISLAGQVAGVVQQALSGIDFGKVGQIFGDLGNAMTSLFSTIDFGAIGNMFSMAFSTIIQTISMFAPAFAPLMQTIGVIINLVVQIGTALIPIIGIILQISAIMYTSMVTVIQVVVNVIAGILSAIIAVFSGVITVVAGAIGVVTSIIQGGINVVGAVVNKIAVFFTEAFNKAKTIAQNVINSIKGFFDGLIGKVGEIANGIKNAFNIKPPAWMSGIGGFLKGRYIGDRSWEGGPVNVAEKGAEMIKLPSGQQFLAGHEMIMDLPQGTEISTAESTRRMIKNGLGGIGKAFQGTSKGKTSKSERKAAAKTLTFAPQITVINGKNEENLEDKIYKILNRFFEEKIIATGGV